MALNNSLGREIALDELAPFSEFLSDFDMRSSGTTPMIGLEQTDLSLSQMLATSNLNDEPTTPFQPLSTSQGMSAILYDDDEEEPPAKATKRRYEEYATNNPRMKSISESSSAPIKSPFRVAANYAPEQQPKMPAQSILAEILELQKNQKIQLENIRANQRHIISQQQKNETALIDAEEKQLKSSLENELKLLFELYEQAILRPGELHRWDYLRHELEYQLKQIEVLIEELGQFTSSAVIRKPAASLMITRQPFPQVPPCKEQLSEDSLVLRLIQGSCVKVKAASPVKAVLIMENHPIASHKSAGVKDEKMLEGEIQPFDINQGVAKFPLTFLKGTRKNTVNLRFSLQLEAEQAGASFSSTIESNSSQPFVVMTNQKQWEACEGTLLKKDAFGERLEIPWPQFANALSKQFLRATKQDPTQPTRYLSHYDFEYIRNKFFGGENSVTQKDFDAFWSWFGKCVQVLRYQRHIGSLWMSGYIIGFMTRDDVTSALSGQLPGTFLVRFSESNPGQFGIAYVVNEEPPRIKHYLVQPNDTAAAKVTLADFCKDKPQFTHILQFAFDSNQPLLIRQPKHQALNPYYSKRVERPAVAQELVR